VRPSRLCDVTLCPHPGTDTDGRGFRLNIGRTVSSSNTNAGELEGADPRNEGRRPGLGPTPTTAGGADTGPGMSACHDIPSRSVNSVFTPANDRHKSAHCAWKKKKDGVTVSRQSYSMNWTRWKRCVVVLRPWTSDGSPVL